MRSSALQRLHRPGGAADRRNRRAEAGERRNPDRRACRVGKLHGPPVGSSGYQDAASDAVRAGHGGRGHRRCSWRKGHQISARRSHSVLQLDRRLWLERMVAKEWKCVRLPASVAFEPAALRSGTIMGRPIPPCSRRGASATWRNSARHGSRRRGRPRRGSPRLPPRPARHRRRRIRRQGGHLVRAYGASDVINYGRENLRERVKAATDGEGVDVCFDNVGGAIFQTTSRPTGWGGRLMPIGFTSGSDTLGADEPPAIEELLHRWGRPRSLDRQIS